MNVILKANHLTYHSQGLLCHMFHSKQNNYFWELSLGTSKLFWSQFLLKLQYLL